MIWEVFPNFNDSVIPSPEPEAEEENGNSLRVYEPLKEMNLKLLGAKLF